MPDAFTVFWTQDRCAAAGFVVATRAPLQLLFGGPHLSLPSFARAKVAVGDLVYPIGVHRKKLYVLGRMRVAELTASTESPYRIDEYVRRFPRWSFLTGHCTNEVVVGTEGTPLRLDAAMPPELLQRLTYRSQRATRLVKHVDEDGLLVRSLGVQGIYQVAPHCVPDLDAVLAQPRNPAARTFNRSAQQRAIASVQSEALFWRSFHDAAPDRPHE